MGCSGNILCDIVDLVVCAIRCFLEEVCNVKVALTFCILPSLMADFLLDGLGMIRMMFLSCVFYNGNEYYEGGEEYAFSFDPTEIINLCDLNDTQLKKINLTEVSHHKAFVFCASPWLTIISFYMIGCLIYYIICFRKIIKYNWSSMDFELTVYQYVIAFGAVKVLNIYATGLIFVKSIFVFIYVTPDAVEVIICIISIIDLIWSIKEMILILALAKKNNIHEIRDGTLCCLSNDTRCCSCCENSFESDRASSRNTIYPQEDDNGEYYFHHVTYTTNNMYTMNQSHSFVVVQEL